MKNLYKFKLDESSKKHHCPACGKKKYVRYINSVSGKYLPERYGRCDREINCGYHLNPYKEGYGKKEKGYKSNPYSNSFKSNLQSKKEYLTQQIRYPFPKEELIKTLSHYDQNGFLENLIYNVSFPLTCEDVEKVIELYLLGTINNGYMAGATTFPFIDVSGIIRAIQVKQFDKTNHTIDTNFLHSILLKEYKQSGKSIPDWLSNYQNNDSKVSCLFGEHLLNQYPNNPIALVEAPKTAVYGTLYFGLPEKSDNFLWIAVYSLRSLTFDKCKVLAGRKVILFPDLSKDGEAFKLWSSRAEEFNTQIPSANFIVSDLLETKAYDEERQNGLDLADYLIKMDWREFRSSSVESEENIQSIEKQNLSKLTDKPEKAITKSQTNAFVTSDGRLCFETPFSDKYTVYLSIEDYNKRTCLPEFKSVKFLDSKTLTPVVVDSNTLTISV